MTGMSVAGGTPLSYDEAKSETIAILEGRKKDDEIMQMLGSMSERGESDEELEAMLGVMRGFMRIVTAAPNTVDVCGTGGDSKSTFNISTAAAFVTAAAGVPVAKHGNRSSSGLCGSADIFEALGCDLMQEPSDAERLLKRYGICFMFAPVFHPAMKYVAAARKKLGTRTAFNILGPLCNPARVTRQLIGVSSPDLLERIPRILLRSGSESVFCAISNSGMDELGTFSKNRAVLLRDSEITQILIDPASLGLHESSLADIRVSSRREALQRFVSVLAGDGGTAATETVALNAAAALVASGTADEIAGGLEISLDILRDGAAYRLLETFLEDCGDASRLEGTVE